MSRWDAVSDMDYTDQHRERDVVRCRCGVTVYVRADEDYDGPELLCQRCEESEAHAQALEAR